MNHKEPIIIHDPITNNVYLGVKYGNCHALIKGNDNFIKTILVDQCRIYPATVTKHYTLVLIGNKITALDEDATDQDTQDILGEDMPAITILSNPMPMEDAYTLAVKYQQQMHVVYSLTEYDNWNDIAYRLSIGEKYDGIVEELKQDTQDHAYDRSVRY